MHKFLIKNKILIALLIGIVIVVGTIYFSGLRSTPSTPSKSDCVIKGNIASKGEKIYHLPGCGSYEKTAITESRGERWFCSEEEAISAGWRKAKNCP